MGRHVRLDRVACGGIAGGADIILIPEIPFDFDNIASVSKAREAAVTFEPLLWSLRPRD